MGAIKLYTIVESDVHDNGTAIKLSLAGSFLLMTPMVQIHLAAQQHYPVLWTLRLLMPQMMCLKLMNFVVIFHPYL